MYEGEERARSGKFEGIGGRSSGGQGGVGVKSKGNGNQSENGVYISNPTM